MSRLINRLSLLTTPFLLAALAYTQAPAPAVPVPNIKIAQINLKGCVGGTDPDYTIAEDQTGRVVKITPSGVDLNPHLGQDVKLVGHNASGALTSGAADNSFIANEVTMISDHCAAAPIAAVTTPDTPTSPATPTAPAPAVPVAAVSPSPAPPTAAQTPAVAPPAVTISTTSGTVTTPGPTAASTAAAVAPLNDPAATFTTPPATVTTTVATPAVVAPAAVEAKVATSRITDKVATADHSPRQHKRKAAADAIPEATASASTETATTPLPTEPPTNGIPSTPPAAAPSATTTATSPTPGAAPPAVPAKTGFPLWLGVVTLVLVLGLGGTAPLLNKWRKGQTLGEPTAAQSLSLTPTADPVPDDMSGPRKVA